MTDPYYTVETLEADRSVGYLVKRCGIVMTQIAERGFEGQPITFTHWIILMSLTQRPHCSPTELSAQTGHDMGALTRVVDHLEREGLVVRERSQHDRRAVEIAITPEGRRLAHGGKRVVVDLLNQLLGPYSKAEIEGFISLLQRFLTQMQEFQAQTQNQAHLRDPANPATAGHPGDTPAPHPNLTSVRRGKHQPPRTNTSGTRRTRKATRR
jgi:DNA-binding MarR family transcriptional regulator